MIRFPRRWSDVDKISYLQRKIILNSILYYEFDKSTLPDKVFDELSHQLVEMQLNYKGNIENDTEYGYMMCDFDGSTGFDLSSRLNYEDREYLTSITTHYIQRHYTSEIKPKKRRLF